MALRRFDSEEREQDVDFLALLFVVEEDESLRVGEVLEAEGEQVGLSVILLRL